MTTHTICITYYQSDQMIEQREHPITQHPPLPRPGDIIQDGPTTYTVEAIHHQLAIVDGVAYIDLHLS